MKWLALFVLLGAGTAGALAAPAKISPQVRLFFGPEYGPGPQLTRDLARLVARPAGVNLRPQMATGSVDILQRLRQDPGALALAILPVDTAAAYLHLGELAHPEAKSLLASVRVIAPVFREQIYLVVRNDDSLISIQDIQDLRINVGPPKSSESVTMATLYRMLFGQPLQEEKLSFLEHKEALVKLITDQTIDVVAMVGAPPFRVLAEMKPEARRFVKLLPFAGQVKDPALLKKVYSETIIRAADYPSLLSEDLPALSVNSLLVVQGPRGEESDGVIRRLVASWCSQQVQMRAGNPAILSLGVSELPPGWHYSPIAAHAVASCNDVKVPPLLSQKCSVDERILGLCR